MRFEFVLCASLPRMAWCAQLQQGSELVRVHHGPWVETREGWFVEGAWSGDFEAGELDRAAFNLGSGGVLRAGRAVFCTQSDTIERLYSVRVGAELFLSNSLVFLLAMTDDEPDPGFPFYYHALRAHAMDGIRRTRKTIHTGRGRRVALHDRCQLEVGPDLRVARIEKPADPRPESYGEYVAQLEGVLASVLANAASPARRSRRFAGLATVSGGYDSNALAALLARLGVREAITFADGASGKDSGAEVARRLGMTVREFDRRAFRGLRSAPEAEFFTGPRGFDVVLAPCEEALVGKVLVIGRNGDIVFGLDPARKLAGFQTLREHVPSGSTLLEFRLRVGFLNFNPLFTAGLHLSALDGISRSEEMRPWRLGGSYDRPIARRILEEAGIPRGCFGVRKARSAAIYLKTPAAMSPEGRADFESYRRSMPRPAWWRRPWQWGLVKLRTRARRLGVAERLIPVPRQYDRVNEMDFAMHWGHARVRPRYAEAVAAKDQGAPRPVTV
ncbi:MAG TPA: hypothetical protein VII72_01245 [Myxococcota bacterium]|jgi:hypothetical protein